MLIVCDLPDDWGLRLDHTLREPAQVTLFLSAINLEACCPVCQQPARRIHSRYQRTLADLPAGPLAVRLQVTVHRFFCRTIQCPRWIFAERLPALARPWAQRTLRLATTLQQVGLVCGGEPGARITRHLALSTSPDTLLRAVRQIADSELPTPRVLGVDDWSYRRGHCYGTLLIDLEQHRPVDVLPERTVAALATWLLVHPGVEIISRDRAQVYADGATLGAPTAVQVVDRWHLLKNLGEAVQRVLDRHPVSTPV